MIKYLIWIFIIGISISQEYEDVIYLKNGSIIHGMIIEQKPNEYIKIQSGENTLVFQMDEIDIIKKELIIIPNDYLFDPNTGERIKSNDSNIIDKTWSAGIGIGTSKNFNIIQISKDFKFSDNFSVFIYGGLVNFGLGVTSQDNYNKNGLIFGLSGGVTLEGLGAGSLSFAYQWRLKNGNTYISLGLASYAYESYYCDYYHCNKIEYDSIIVPVISFDYRW